MSETPKILLTNASLIYAGGEYYVLELAKELTNRNIDVTVCCHTQNLLYKKCKIEGIKLFGLDFPEKGKLLKQIKILKDHIKEFDYDIIHTNTNYDRTAGAFAAKLAGKKHITNVHSFQSIANNITQKYRNRSATDLFITDGHCVKELLINKDKIPAEKIKVLQLGIDPEITKKEVSLRKKVRDEFNIKDNEVLIGNTGRLEEFKGQEYLIRAIAILRNKDNVKVIIVGDGRLEMMLKDLSEELKISDRIIFAGFRDDLQALYSAFDIYAHPSIEGGGETFPFSVLYSLAAGIPAIVTKVGDVAEMIIENETGFVVNEKDVISLSNKLELFISDESMRVEFGKRALVNLKDKFTITKMTDNVVRFYEEVLD